MLGREMKRGFHPAGSVLFFDLGDDYTGYLFGYNSVRYTYLYCALLYKCYVLQN